ncbi:MAG: nuclear transport factor 2 family protein [Hymenobacteraceae bacterium]|nr:nuclear transport factor 2 family protein [Hymenobacteraceae bacterium]
MNRKIKNILFALVVATVAYGCATRMPSASDKLAVQQVLQEQSRCWNKGDLSCYMQGYWKSDSLLFIGSRGLTYGWEQTLSNYQKSYPDKAAMGELTFTILEQKPLATDAMLVVGQWHLARKAGDLKGHFSVVFQKIDGKWVITSDHSS